MARFLASGSGGLSGFCSAEIFGARQFVAGIVNHFIRPQFRRSVGTETIDFARQSQPREQQSQLQKQRSGETAIRHSAGWSFTGERRPGARESGTD